MKEFFKRLRDEFLEDKDYAHSYMASHAVSRIAAQIHALRKQRGWSQEQLSEQTGIAQERISKIESADFNSITLKTLHKFSKAFDVNLNISFEPFSRGILDVANLTKDKLEVKNRIDDLSRSFTDRAIVVKSDGEWKHIDYLMSVSKISPPVKLNPQNGSWQRLESVKVKSVA